MKNNSKDIAIRVSSSPSVGFGHIRRCLRLATQLESFGYRATFWIDKEQNIPQIFADKFQFNALYFQKNTFNSEEEDAYLFLASINKISFACVIVDDYRLTKVWEKLVRKKYSIIAFDDENNRNHDCDILIDSNWRGSDTYSRYLNLVPTYTKRLLGPQYAILCNSPDQLGASIPFVKRLQSPEILLSLGGGGDVNILLEIAKSILGHSKHKSNISIKLIIGPCAINASNVLDYAKKNKQIVPIMGRTSLDDIYLNASLYIGSAGTTMYEALIYKIPSITFSLSENQKYENKYLEDLGHYFHFNDFQSLPLRKLAELSCLVIDNLERISVLYSRNPKKKMDGYGAKRLAAKVNDFINSQEIIDSSAEGDCEILQVEDLSTSNKKILEFKRVSDSEINSYLLARNLPANSMATARKEKIEFLDHYIWWLKTDRSIYALYQNGTPRVYCWHEIVCGVNQYLKGGFFAAQANTSGLETIKAVVEHHRLTDAEHPEIKWYAFSERENSFAMILNRRVGFQVVEKSPENTLLFLSIFGDIDFEKYIYYKKIPINY